MYVIFSPREKHATKLNGMEFLQSYVIRAHLYPIISVVSETLHVHMQKIKIETAIACCK